MKRKVAVKILRERLCNKQFEGNAYALEEIIQSIADDDESFENIVFELGCSVLANAYLKKIKRGMRN